MNILLLYGSHTNVEIVFVDFRLKCYNLLTLIHSLSLLYAWIISTPPYTSSASIFACVLNFLILRALISTLCYFCFCLSSFRDLHDVIYMHYSLCAYIYTQCIFLAMWNKQSIVFVNLISSSLSTYLFTCLSLSNLLTSSNANPWFIMMKLWLFPLNYMFAQLYLFSTPSIWVIWWRSSANMSQFCRYLYFSPSKNQVTSLYFCFSYKKLTWHVMLVCRV